MSITLSRRNFIIGTTAAAGLSIGVLASCAPKEEAATGPVTENEVGAWVQIASDDTVTIRIARSEMGQGTLTGLAQLVAEELECDWKNVTTEYPTPGENARRDRVWGSFGTGGSSGIRRSHDYVRQGGAAAREMLKAAAAQTWEVSIDDVSTENGYVLLNGTKKKLRYGALAQLAGAMELPTDITLKDPDDWTIIGQPKMRLDTSGKLDGSQIYGADFTLPGMLMASVKACPIMGGKIKSYDASEAEARKGVTKVMKIGDNAIVVIAESWWTANDALEKMPIEWDGGKNADFSSADVHKMLDEGLTATDTFTGNKAGDVAVALKAADKIITAEYGYSTQNHATMEPMNATALWTAEKCEVWCPTQNGEAALQAAVAASGLPAENCDVYKLHLGGGFGRRGMSDFVTQAVTIAKEFPGTPIKLMWSREEDMAHGFYHPVTKAKVTGGLSADGKLTAMDMKISGQSILAGLNYIKSGDMDPAVFQGLFPSGVDERMEDQTMKYTIPNVHIHHAMRNPPIRPGFWRGVNINQNAVYLDCFLDEMAHAAGRDALEFRLENMTDHPKMAAVLKAAAEGGGWGKNDGKHRGLSALYAFGSYVAACAEVSVNDEGDLKIHKITAATDPGHAVNPQQIEAQVEGSFVYGLTAMLYGEITYANGQTVERNFDTYPSLRIAEMPEVETIIMPSGGFWGGVGEPTIAVAAPAVLNGIFAATGQRIRSLPIKEQKLRAI